MVESNAVRLATFAIRVQSICASFEGPDGMPIRMRCGIHTAPAVGGIVGRLLLRYTFSCAEALS